MPAAEPRSQPTLPVHARLVDEMPEGGRLDSMAGVMHTLGSVEARYESTVVGTALLDRPVDIGALRTRVHDELLAFWPFRCVVGSSDGKAAATWREAPRVDVNSHVTSIEIKSEADLPSHVGDSLAEPWDWSRPLWHIYLVSFSDVSRSSSHSGACGASATGAKCAVVVRMNHILSDGVTMLKIFLCLFDGGRANAVDPPRRRGGAHGSSRALVSALRPVPGPLRPIFRALLSGARRFWVAVNGFLYGILLPILPGDSASTLKLASCQGSPGLSARRAAAAGTPLPLSLVKEIKDAFGCTVNDVLVAAVTGAVRRALEARGERAEGKRLRALFPYNMRPDDGPDPLDALGNSWAMLNVGLPVGRATASARLVECARRCDEMKLSPEAPVLFSINRLGHALLPARAFAKTTFDLMDKMTLLMSNVAGPADRLRLLGAQAPDLRFYATSMVGTCFDVLTYDGYLRPTVIGDPAVLGDSDAEALVQAFGDEVAALHAAARERSAAGADGYAADPVDWLAWRRLLGLVAITAVITAAAVTA